MGEQSRHGRTVGSRVSQLVELLERSVELAGDMLLSRQPWPAEETNAERVLASGLLRLTSGGWYCQHQSEWRYTRVSAPKIEVVTHFLYPAPNSWLPLYAMEIVVFGGRPVVAVFDAVAMHQGSRGKQIADELLANAHLRFPELVNADDAPAWYQDCRSGDDFFLRPAMHDMPRVIDLHEWLWSAWFNALRAHERAPVDENSAQRVANYKRHHREHSPGLPLMQKNFGAHWTERFLAAHFFA